jgi:hypothetical protein
MKTTIDIASNIMERAKDVAHADGVTFRELVEEGLLLAVRQREVRVHKPIKPVTVKGKGKHEAFRYAAWEQIRDAAYQGRGA